MPPRSRLRRCRRCSCDSPSICELAALSRDYCPAGVPLQLTRELDAFTEIRLRSGVEAGEFEAVAKSFPEIQQYFTIAGDPDGLVRFRARNVDHLQQVVNKIRKTPIVAGTKTLIVMSVWDRTVLPAIEPDRSVR